jgi:lipopolysaccharide exporter
MVVDHPSTVAPSGVIRRGLIWSTASNMVLRVSNLLVGIIMARVIAPEAFGVFAVALTVWSILSALAEFGLGADLVRRPDFERHVPTVATMGAVLSGVLAGVMYLFSPAIAVAFGSEEATGVIQLMAIPLLLIGLSVVPAALLQRNFRQGTVFAVDGSALVISTGVMVLFAVLGAGAASLAFGRIAGQASTVILQYLAVRRWPVFGWDRSVARETIAFGLPLALANVVSWSIITVDNLVVARMAGVTELGFYVLAFSVASWPMSVAGQSVRVIALPAFARIVDLGRRGRAMTAVSGPIWAVSAVMAIGLMAVAPQLVTTLYGERWAAAAGAVVPLAAFGAFRVMFDLSATYLIACGMTRRVLIVQVIWVVFLIPAMITGISVAGIAGAGWAHVAVAAGVVLPAYLICLRGAHVPPLRFVAAWAMPTMAAIPLIGALWLLPILISPPVPVLLIAAALGLVFYVLPMSRWWLARARSLTQLE